MKILSFSEALFGTVMTATSHINQHLSQEFGASAVKLLDDDSVQHIPLEQCSALSASKVLSHFLLPS